MSFLPRTSRFGSQLLDAHTEALEFDFTIDVRPEFELPELKSLTVQRPSLEVTDESLTRLDDPVERRVTTVGRVLPHTEVKIVDDDRRVVPRGTSGELLTRGYCVMQGYWNDPERTAQSIDAAHWIASGDLALASALSSPVGSGEPFPRRRACHR